jgi:spore maturation protein CgeB/glycosyltransferase involved in cell wall biosynthesis/SAM-dependent methyltransferase
MRETQERIHWICARVQGQRVLDVGCSQGITSLLLAREGKSVLGVDVDRRSIEEARALAAQEPERVQACLKLEQVDFLNLPSPEQPFDTLVMSEVLEHLVLPQSFIEATPRFLRPGGRLVVTVPFGVNDFIDHKHTFYLLEPYRLMATRFDIEEVQVLGKWIGLVGILRAGAEQAPTVNALDASLIGNLESGFEVLERDIREQAKSYRAKLHEANLKYRSATEQVATYKQRLASEESARKQASVQALELEGRIKSLQASIDATKQLQSASESQAAQWQSEHNELLAERNRLQVELHQATLGMAKAEAQAGELRERVSAQDRLVQQWSENVRATGEHTASEAAGQVNRLAQLQSELLGELRSQREHHAAERAHWQQQLSELHERKEAVQLLHTRAESTIEALEQQHRTLTQQLEASTRSVEALREAAAQDQREFKLEALQLKERIEALLSEIDELRAVQAEADRDAAAASAERQRLEAMVQELESARRFLLTDLDTVQAELHASRQKLDRQAETHAAEAMEWRAEVDQHAQRVRQLDQQLIASLEQIEHLQQQLEGALDTLRTASEQQSALEAQLNTAREQVLEQQQRLLTLGSELDTERAIGRDQRLQKEKLQLQLLQAKRQTDELRAELERTRQLRLAAEDQVSRTRSTFSFRLGYALLHGFKSVDAMLRLPGQLWALNQEGRRRRQEKQGAKQAVRKTEALRLAGPSLGQPSRATRTASALGVPSGPLLGSGLAGPEALRGLKVAAIMDEFTRASFAPECNLLSLSVDRWNDELDAFKPDMLFIESAWRGKDDRWGNKVGHLSAEVQGVLAWCREHKVPTAFWNKEDPIHFETFLNTARLFDHVFTTDIDCIPRYKAALAHDRVHLLPFACQPALSNPIEQYERKDAFCFAGAYYVRYPDRTRDLGNFVSHLAEYRPVEIYDRNFGKDDPNYQFPPEYQPFIVGTLPFSEIDKAYKGYRYAINLNSIKQSQSMFARRVFELLASNTLTISNFSRGVRTLFGDLVITSDSGPEIVRRLQALESSPQRAALLRLAGLRKVMQEHTYQDRLAFVVGHLQGRPLEPLLPWVTVTAYAKNQSQWHSVLGSFLRQAYPHKRLVVLTPNEFTPLAGTEPWPDTVQVIKASEATDRSLDHWVDARSWVAGMVPDDHYGRHYLTDLALATRYAGSLLVGKGSFAVWSPTHGQQQHLGPAPYTRAGTLAARSSLVQLGVLDGIGLKEWVTSLYTREIELEGALSIDPFSYCKNGAATASELTGLDDAADGQPDALYPGLSLAEVMQVAEALPPTEAAADTDPTLSGAEWSTWFKPPAKRAWHCEVNGLNWEFHSNLQDGQHEYLYAARDVAPAEIGAEGEFRCHLDVSPGLNVQLVVLFLDANRQRISHAVKVANRNHEIPVPAGTAFVRLGLRIYGSGSARVQALVLGHRPMQPGATLPQAEHLLLTNHYPSYDDLYRNGFVHSRVTAYREHGVRVDVFRLRADQPTGYHEYQNIDVVTGSQQALHRMLSTGQYKTVLVHFLDPAMWEVLSRHIDRVRVVVWVHGADIQPYHRRSFAYETEQEHQVARTRSDERMAFWKQLLNPMPANLKLVFVSRYLAETSMEDLGFRLPDDAYTIIPNPIDTDLFSYQPKPAEQRKKILSIRPYSSRIYANDLSVAAILELSKEPFFNDLEFRLIGDGKLFETTLAPLAGLPNVIIEQRFLTQQQIAEMHKSYGVFLCPTRMDTQGVSRDEAMASGLVPVTTDSGAVSEFVSPDCGQVTDLNFKSIANSLTALINNENEYVQMSLNAAKTIATNRSARILTSKEIATFN